MHTQIMTRARFSLPGRWLRLRLAIAAGLAALADILFFGQAIGFSFALFLGSVGAACVITNPIRATQRVRKIAWVLFGLALLPLVEDFSWLSGMIGLIGTACFVLIMARGFHADVMNSLNILPNLLIVGAFQLTDDVTRVHALKKRLNVPVFGFAHLATWVVPLVLFVVFLMLFASANPLIDSWLSSIDLRALADLLQPSRIFIWTLVIVIVWPLIHVQRAKARRAAHAVSQSQNHMMADPNGFFGVAAISRSLVSFNALFAMQSAMDIAYLWGGMQLPNGMSYADYAHRGAYPLVATSLLAAGFVLMAMRRGGPAESSKLIKPLVLIWTAQNVLLVISSIIRLDLYVAVYSLTYLRVAAFIWMGLVVNGLVLIIAKIMWAKSNDWLIRFNLGALGLVLYACCFINFPHVMAQYNVEHGRILRQYNLVDRTTKTFTRLDFAYLQALGPQVIPALDSFIQHQPDAPNTTEAKHIRSKLLADHTNATHGWRAWTFRAWRLDQYLAMKG